MTNTPLSQQPCSAELTNTPLSQQPSSAELTRCMLTIHYQKVSFYFLNISVPTDRSEGGGLLSGSFGIKEKKKKKSLVPVGNRVQIP